MRGALPIMSITKNIHTTSIILNEERPIMSLKLVTKKIFELNTSAESCTGISSRYYNANICVTSSLDMKK